MSDILAGIVVLLMFVAYLRGESEKVDEIGELRDRVERLERGRRS
jgi:hypothetical protein